MEACRIYYCEKKKDEKSDFYRNQLLQIAFREYFGCSYEQQKVNKGMYGKPLYDKAGVHYNISHCEDMVVVACAHTNIGVDVEARRTTRDNAKRRSCSEAEYQWLITTDDKDWNFLRLWTLKESYIKMLGEGLRYPLKEIAFSFTQSQDGVRIEASQEAAFYQINDLEGRILAVCLPIGYSLTKDTVTFQKVQVDTKG